MSRIGKQPVGIPDKVTVVVASGTVTVKGPKGELQFTVPAGISVAVADRQVTVTRSSDSKAVRALHGLTRATIANMVAGVVQPYRKDLEIHGKGWKVELKGKNLSLSVGFSQPVVVEPVAGMELTVTDATHFSVSGIDKQQVGDTAAKLRKIRPPEPYQGAGIRYVNEHIRRKEVKKGV